MNMIFLQYPHVLTIALRTTIPSGNFLVIRGPENRTRDRETITLIVEHVLFEKFNRVESFTTFHQSR